MQQKIFMILTAISAAICVIYLQQRFEAADVKNGVGIAQSYRAPSGKTIPDVLSAEHPGATVAWNGSETSACFQHIRVGATVTKPGEPTILVLFDIDLNGPSIHPANPQGEHVLSALDDAREVEASSADAGSG